MEREENEFLYPVTVSLFPVLGIILYLKEMMEWEVATIILSFGVLFVIVMIHLIFQARKQPILYIITAVIVVVIGSILFLKRNDIVLSENEQGILLRIGIIVGLSIASYVITKILILKGILALGLLTAMIIAGSYEREGARLGVAAAMTYCILVLMEICISHSIKKMKVERKRVLSAMLPVYIICLILLLFTPVSSECMQWKLAKSIYASAKTLVLNIYDDVKTKNNSDYGEFDVAIAGYSESGSIGGAVNDSPRTTALRLETSEKQKSSIYLAGSYKNEFVKGKWKDTITNTSYPLPITETKMDTLELLYALQRYNSFHDSKAYLTLNYLKIQYAEIETKTVFHSLKTDILLTNADKIKQKKGNGNMTLEKLARREGDYSFTYYSLNYGGSLFREFLQKTEGYQYDPDKKIDITLKNGSNLTLDANFEQQLVNRRRFIYDHYLDVDSNIPERVGELAREVTKDAKTNYEKMKALENFLHGYKYSLQPQKIPYGKQLLDYFLFNSKEGYCTYFATAMAVMGRTIGIPTRYVQGFLVSGSPKGWKTCEVSNKDAHAWVEAYIDGVGWLTFEPTSGYEKEKYTPWTVERENTLKENSVSPKKTAEIHLPEEKEQIQEDAPVHEKSNPQKGIVVVLIILLLTIVMIRCKIQMNQYYYRKASNRAKIIYEIRCMQQMLLIFHITMCENDTWAEYIEKIKKKELVEEQLLEEIEGIFSRMRYRLEEPKDDEVGVYLKINQELLLLIKSKFGKSKYYVSWMRIHMRPMRLEIH